MCYTISYMLTATPKNRENATVTRKVRSFRSMLGRMGLERTVV
jgi:hypothetical protein